MNKLKILFKYAWAVAAACVAVFFAVALTVYVKAEPENVSELLVRDKSRLNDVQLSTTAGDLEQYPYVTNVYRYETDVTRLDIKYYMKDNYRDMVYGVVEDADLPCNYLVELFVWSDIADKALVKRWWNVSVDEEQPLTLTRTYDYRKAGSEFDELKKVPVGTPNYFVTFVRITAKPEYSKKIEFHNIKIQRE